LYLNLPLLGGNFGKIVSATPFERRKMMEMFGVTKPLSYANTSKEEANSPIAL
jgi:hypothetical protein